MKKIVKVIMATLILCPLTPVTQSAFVDIASAATLENVKPTVLSSAFSTGTIFVCGTATPGSSVELWNAGNKITTVTASYTGHWSAKTNGLTPGIVQVRATLNGVSLDSDQYTLMSKPTITKGFVTGAQIVSGTATPGASVDVSNTGNKVTTTTADSEGNWTAMLTSGLVVGNVQVRATLGEMFIDSDQYTVLEKNTKPIITSELVSGVRTVSGTAAPGALIALWGGELRGMIPTQIAQVIGQLRLLATPA